ncbi:thiamine phosphate synthase [Gammaproteobacteria bacterium LSUCC0112]|nr:thiamine phosphate synthase [Gammaproteobacteria bacterium LSUCC0112]
MQHHLLSGLYAITDDTLLPEDTLLTACESALRGGVSILQYRSKAGAGDAKSFSKRRETAAALLGLCHRYNAALLINDDIDLCQAANADGVHLGQKDMHIAEARHRLGPDAIIGVTCHNKDELVATSEKLGAEYVALGRFFNSTTKPDAPAATIEDLKRIRSNTNLPIVAIGGVNAENAQSLIDAGADMIAVIHYLFSSDQVFARAKILSSLFAQKRK